MSPQETYDDLVATLTALKEGVESVYADSPELPAMQQRICHIRCRAEVMLLGTATDCDEECGSGIDDDDAYAKGDDGSDGEAYDVEELEEQPDDGENHGDYFMEDEAREEIIARYGQRKGHGCGCGSRGGCTCH